MERTVSIFAFYQEIAERLNRRIAEESNQFIAGTTTEELTEYYFSESHYTPIELDEERSITGEIKVEKRIIRAWQREGPFQSAGDLIMDFEFYSVLIPIVPHQHLSIIKTFQPSRYDTGFSGEELRWSPADLTFNVPIRGYNIHKTEDGIKKEVEQSIQWVKNKLEYIASDLEVQNRELKAKIIQIVISRKRKIEEDLQRRTSLEKLINIPIQRKSDDPAKQVRVNPRPLAKRVRPNPQQPEEYVLDEGKVLEIISVLDNQGRQFEKTPFTYQKLEEEELRNIILVNLNSLFEGAATGETFCNKGKTDIYLQLPKGNILAFECKFWSGCKRYQDTINQLLNYLTWRMNYGVIVLFSNQKNFTNVLAEGQKAIQEHSSFRGNFAQIKSSHYRSYHALSTDEQKHVQLHHLFYTIATS